MFRGGKKPLAFSREGYVWLLGSIANLFRLPFDGRLVLNQSPPPHTLSVAVDALEVFGVSARARTVKRGSQLKRLPVPALAILCQRDVVAECAVEITPPGKPRARL